MKIHHYFLFAVLCVVINLINHLTYALEEPKYFIESLADGRMIVYLLILFLTSLFSVKLLSLKKYKSRTDESIVLLLYYTFIGVFITLIGLYIQSIIVEPDEFAYLDETENPMVKYIKYATRSISDRFFEGCLLVVANFIWVENKNEKE